LPETGPGEPVAAGDDMADRETRLVVADALASLPEEQRVPIVLVDVEGYSVADTAKLLGIAEGTVKSRCARGRAKLAKVLGHLRNPSADANVPVEQADAARIRPTRRGEGR
jgi:RNA polymerase sigma-70 factor (ECF subfamily)